MQNLILQIKEADKKVRFEQDQQPENQSSGKQLVNTQSLGPIFANTQADEKQGDLDPSSDDVTPALG